jgi:hypothetical protein
LAGVVEEAADEEEPQHLVVAAAAVAVFRFDLSLHLLSQVA